MKITEKTTIPLSMAWVGFTAIVGAVYWLTTMYSLTNANAQNYASMKQQQKDDRESILDSLRHIQRDQTQIRSDVSEIRGEVNALMRETKKRQ